MSDFEADLNEIFRLIGEQWTESQIQESFDCVVLFGF